MGLLIARGAINRFDSSNNLPCGSVKAGHSHPVAAPVLVNSNTVRHTHHPAATPPPICRLQQVQPATSVDVCSFEVRCHQVISPDFITAQTLRAVQNGVASWAVVLVSEVVVGYIQFSHFQSSVLMMVRQSGRSNRLGCRLVALLCPVQGSPVSHARSGITSAPARNLSR